jgi:hypothetical protein
MISLQVREGADKTGFKAEAFYVLVRGALTPNPECCRVRVPRNNGGRVEKNRI